MDYEYEDEDLENYEDAMTIQCYCEGHCPFGDLDTKGICDVTVPGGKCFASVVVETDEYGDEYPNLSFGCLPDPQMATLQCKGSLVPHLQAKNIECCDDSDFCNTNLYPMYTVENVSLHEKLPYILLSTSFAICFLVLLLAVVGLSLRYRKKTRNEKEVNNNSTLEDIVVNDDNISQEIVLNSTSSNLPQLIEESSGSGSGLPVMVQRTIAKQIEMMRTVGRGRYGEVWLAKWRGEKVAAKVFLTTEEASWFRETEIYQTVLMRHENVLGFIAADIRGNGSWTQMILITDFQEHGSLFDFLQTHTMDMDSLLTMSWSISRGLTHLHTEIFGVHGKPSIAHRDLKSKNILVKSNGECCIADFGLAVKFQSNSNKIDLPSKEKSGTTRYMAPEILDCTIDYQSIDAHKMADIYAFGLVLWEMSRRCNFEDQYNLDYQIPFEGYVSSDPGFEEMRNVVCIKKIRPTMPDSWMSHGIMSVFTKIMQEMWHDNPAVRLTALRVKKTLNKLRIAEDITLDIYTADLSSKQIQD